MSVGGSVLALTLFTACGPGVVHPPITKDMRDVATDAIVGASGDANAIRALLEDEITIGGIAFADATCKEFSAGRFDATKLVAIAHCLAGLHWVKSDRTDAIADVTVVSYAPGFELEARVLRADDDPPRLTWIGFATRREGDTAPTITREALDAMLVEGPKQLALPANVARPARAWLRVCVDESGASTTKTLSTSSPAAAAAIEEAAKAWRFKPFEVDGWPMTACASVRVQDPPRAGPESLPPAPARGSIMIDEATMLDTIRISGQLFVVPDKVTKQAVMRAGLERLVGTFRFCLDVHGSVDSVTVLRTTRSLPYDLKIMNVVKEWKYRRFLVDGVARPVCTSVTFVYSQRWSNMRW